MLVGSRIIDHDQNQDVDLQVINSKAQELNLAIVLCSSSADVIARWRQGLSDEIDTIQVTDPDLLKALLSERPSGVVLFDLVLCGESALTLATDLISAHPESKIVAMSAVPDTEEGLSLISSGAKGYCNRYISPEVLAQVISIVEMGEVWLGQNLTKHLLENLATAGRSQADKPHVEASDQRLQALTDREQEIARLVGSGEPNKLVAAQLDITERTVKAHLSSIFKKTQTRDRLQLSLLVNTSSL